MKKSSIRHKRIGNLIWCWRCHQYKSVENFHKDKGSLDGHAHECKSCRQGTYKDYQAHYYLAHRDILLPMHRISAIQSKLRRKNANLLKT